jgi:hypothetical protein
LSSEAAARHQSPAKIAGKKDTQIVRLPWGDISHEKNRSANERERSENHKDATKGHGG